jgi:hypothetical protein
MWQSATRDKANRGKMPRMRRGRLTGPPKPIDPRSEQSLLGSTQNIGKSRFPPFPRNIARQAATRGIP